MNQKTLEHLNQIVASAIQSEREAATFYRSLAELAAFSAQKELLLTYAQMEDEHAQALGILQNSGYETLRLKQEESVQNLKINDYLTAPTWTPSRNLSYQDILHIAIKQEEASQRLYTELAREVSSPDAHHLFLHLAQEEAAHKLYFERLYDEEVLTDN